MKRIFTFALALGMTLSLAACGDDNRAVSHSGAGSGADSSPSLPAVDYAPLYEKYTDVSALPVLEIDMDDICVFDDRTLTLEDAISNEPELLTYNLFYYIASAQFDLLMELVGEEEHIQIAMGNERANFEEGYYLTEETLHSLRTLAAEDLNHLSPFVEEELLSLIEACDLEEYVVVQVERSWKYNEAYAAAGPQLSDGEKYIRYYLFAKTAKVPEFKLYDIYWEEFFAE